MGRKHRTERKTKQVWFGQHDELDPPMFSVQQNSTKCGVCVEMLLSRQHDLIVCANWSPRNTRSAHSVCYPRFVVTVAVTGSVAFWNYKISPQQVVSLLVQSTNSSKRSQAFVESRQF